MQIKFLYVDLSNEKLFQKSYPGLVTQVCLYVNNAIFYRYIDLCVTYVFIGVNWWANAPKLLLSGLYKLTTDLY